MQKISNDIETQVNPHSHGVVTDAKYFSEYYYLQKLVGSEN